jgi:type III pantothenate kinase
MEIIAVDIGNSNISLAVFAQDKLQCREDVAVQEAARLAEVFKRFGQVYPGQSGGSDVVPVVCSSVNPPALKVVRQALREALNQELLVAGEDFPIEMKIAFEDTRGIGSDRLLNALAAYDVISSAVVIADFGTAITIDCVNDQGIFIGGVILPGLNLSARSLKDYTALLPLVEPRVPEAAYGINTTGAIQSGIYYGAIGGLREMAERYATELGSWPHVVVTGGMGAMIAQQCDFIDSVAPDLSLYGLCLAYGMYSESCGADEE